MTVESIEHRSADRCIIHISGEEILSSPSIVAELRLFQDKIIDREQLDEIKLLSVRYLVREAAVTILSRRMMSKGELKKKLIEKNYSADLADYASDWCEKQGLINDLYYAEAIVRHYCSKGYGIGRVKNEFSKRMISRELWDDALLCLPDTSDKLDAIISKKLKGSTDANDVRRVKASLFRRGFSNEEIRRAFQNVYENDRYPDY